MQGLQSGTGLQLLQLRKIVLNSGEEELLLALPALKRIYVPFCSWALAPEDADMATFDKLQQRIRGGQSMHAERVSRQYSSFLEAALAELSL